MSQPAYVAASRTASLPVEKYDPGGGSASARTASAGANSSTCWASSSALRPATSATTSKRSRCLRTTSSACVPILPVDPRIAMRLIGAPSCQTWKSGAEVSENDHLDEPVPRRSHEQQRIDTVEHPAVAGKDAPHVFHP